MTQRLDELLRADGHLQAGAPASGKVTIHCFNPAHQDDTPSMSVDLTRGLWYCHGCRKGGDAVKYCIDIRGMTMRNALILVKDSALATDKSSKIRKTLPPGDAEHVYLNDNGDIACVVVRRPRGSTSKTKPFVPALHNGERGWRVGMPPKKPGRPLYRLRELKEHPKEKIVLVLEGEGDVEAWTNIRPDSCAITWMGGGEAWRYTDFGPMRGRKALLIADADEPGRRTMSHLGQLLLKLEVDVKAWIPLGESGRDISDLLAEHGVGGTMELIRANMRTVEPAPELEDPQSDDRSAPPRGLDSTERNNYFEVLGYNERSLFVRNARTKVLHDFSLTGITTGCLLALAPLEFWTQGASLGAKDNQQISSALVREGYRRGFFDLRRVTGRGASKNSDGLIYHFGDSIEVDGEERELNDENLRNFYMMLSPLVRTRQNPDWQTRARDLADAYLEFPFASKMDALKYIGWVGICILAGALHWRPIVWVLGPKGIGKSFLGAMLTELFDDFICMSDNFSDAAVQRTLDNDALPMIIDEAEPQRLPPGFLGTLRTITGNSSVRLRAAPATTKGVVRTAPRGTIMMSSVNLPRLKDTEDSRIVRIRLQSDLPSSAVHERILFKIKDIIETYGPAIRSGLLSKLTDLPTLLHDIKITLGVRTDLRERDLYVPLLAGLELMGMRDMTAEFIEGLGTEGQYRVQSPTESVEMISQILANEIHIGTGGERVASTMFEAAISNETEYQKEAAKRGLIWDWKEKFLKMDHRNPFLNNILQRRYNGAQVSFESMAGIHSDILPVRGKAQRFGHRVVKNWIVIKKSALEAMEVFVDDY